MLSGLGQSKRRASPDTHQVLDAAAALRVREFELFRAADRWWHGRARSDRNLEKIFVHYMFHGTAPPWVRQYCRAVLQAKNDSTLNPAAFGIHGVRPPRQVPSPGPFYVAGTLAIAFFVSVLLLSGHAAAPDASERLSCRGGGPGLAAVENLAYWLGRGESPPACPQDGPDGRSPIQR